MISKIIENFSLFFNPYPHLIRKKFDKGKMVVKFLVNSPVEKWRIESLDGEEKLIEILLKNLKEDDIFYDVGSCIGLYSILVSKKGAISYAFDPDPSVYNHMVKNIELNHLQKKIKTFRCAVSNRQGNVDFYVLAQGEKSSSIINKRDMRIKIKVSATSIDYMIKHKKVEYPTIIKMDIEGAEALAIEGMKSLICSPRRPRMLIIEFHPEFIKLFNTTYQNLRKTIIDSGYKEYYVQSRSNEKNCIFVK